LTWIRTIFLQATGQAWQVLSFSRMCSRTYSPEIFSASANWVCWAFSVGSAPIALTMFISTLVP